MSQKKKTRGGQPPKCRKTKKMGKSVMKNFDRTTLRIYNLESVKIHAMKNLDTLNRYINRIIREDILHTGDNETVKDYFTDEPK